MDVCLTQSFLDLNLYPVNWQYKHEENENSDNLQFQIYWKREERILIMDEMTNAKRRERWILVVKWFSDSNADLLLKRGVHLCHEMVHWIKHWSTKWERTELGSWPKWFTDSNTNPLNERGEFILRNDSLTQTLRHYAREKWILVMKWFTDSNTEPHKKKGANVHWEMVHWFNDSFSYQDLVFCSLLSHCLTQWIIRS